MIHGDDGVLATHAGGLKQVGDRDIHEPRAQLWGAQILCGIPPLGQRAIQLCVEQPACRSPLSEHASSQFFRRRATRVECAINVEIHRPRRWRQLRFTRLRSGHAASSLVPPFRVRYGDRTPRRATRHRERQSRGVAARRHAGHSPPANVLRSRRSRRSTTTPRHRSSLCHPRRGMARTGTRGEQWPPADSRAIAGCAVTPADLPMSSGAIVTPIETSLYLPHY
jgi:hypothetical protein